MPLHSKVGTFGSFLLGVYSYIGLVLNLVGHGLWYESLMELELSSYYHFTLKEGIIWSIYLLPSLVLIFVITSVFKCHKIVAKLFRKTSSPDEAYPIIAALANVSIIFASYIFLLCFIPSLLHPYLICFVAANSGIVGISTFYYIAPPPWEILKSKDKTQYIEALKLEHDWIWRAINMISWATVILAISVIFVSWTQIIFPLVPQEKRNTFAFIKLEAYSTIELMYLIFGLWFGILARLMDYSWRIRKKVAELS
jgi:hypothetical protein